jgi:hypothetical protein
MISTTPQKSIEKQCKRCRRTFMAPVVTFSSPDADGHTATLSASHCGCGEQPTRAPRHAPRQQEFWWQKDCPPLSLTD